MRGCFTQRAAIYYYSGDLVKAAKDYQHLFEQNTPQAIYGGSFGLVELNILQGKFKGTKEILRPYIDLCKKYKVYWPIADVYLKFAYIDLRTNDLQEALNNCNNAVDYALRAEDLGRQRQALHLKGLAYLQMNEVENSLKTAEELRVLTLESHNPNFMHFFHHLTGMIELKQHNLSKAIEHFNEALSMQTGDPNNKQADYIESLAAACYTSGDTDKAQAEYERITSSNSDRIDFGDLYAKIYYLLGKIYEQKGWKGKAIENFEKFLDLWKDADPGLPEVDDAKERLAGLKGEI